MQILTSEQDLSVNFVRPGGQEARYVRRTDDYFIVYLSSHNGCNKACRFCHLTQTGQTDFDVSSVAEMLDQACDVLDHYRTAVASGDQKPAQKIHFNWMARGEPLASPVIAEEWPAIVARLTQMAEEVGIVDLRFNLSSIMPTDTMAELVFKGVQPVIYYSLYSMNPAFRKRWLPKALPPEDALARLARWQQRTSGELVLHWAFIEGENDGQAQCADILDAVERHGLRTRFNLVRYNPFSAGQGREPPEPMLQARLAQMESRMLEKGSRMVPRVGFDVKASCGMFVLHQLLNEQASP